MNGRKLRQHNPWLIGPLLISLWLTPVNLQGQGRPDLPGLYQTGIAALQQGQAVRALQSFQAIAAVDPTFADVQMFLGQSHLVLGQYRDAKKYFEIVVKAQPANGHAAYLLGFSLFESARYVEAVEILERASALAPDIPHPFVYRGLSYLRMGQLEAARENILTADGMAPDDLVAQTAVAELELAEGDYSSAEKRMRAVIEKVPSVDNKLLLAQAILKGGNPLGAVSMLQELDDTLPDRSDVLYLLAQCQLRGGESDRGKSTLERFKKQRGTEERIRVLEAGLSTGKADPKARVELTRLLIAGEQKGKAGHHLSILERTLSSDPAIARLKKELAKLGS